MTFDAVRAWFILFIKTASLAMHSSYGHWTFINLKCWYFTVLSRKVGVLLSLMRKIRPFPQSRDSCKLQPVHVFCYICPHMLRLNPTFDAQKDVVSSVLAKEETIRGNIGKLYYCCCCFVICEYFKLFFLCRCSWTSHSERGTIWSCLVLMESEFAFSFVDISL